jgi:hypothetical protein
MAKRSSGPGHMCKYLIQRTRTCTDHFNPFVEAQVKEGRFDNAVMSCAPFQLIKRSCRPKCLRRTLFSQATEHPTELAAAQGFVHPLRLIPSKLASTAVVLTEGDVFRDQEARDRRPSVNCRAVVTGILPRNDGPSNVLATQCPAYVLSDAFLCAYVSHPLPAPIWTLTGHVFHPITILLDGLRMANANR